MSRGERGRLAAAPGPGKAFACSGVIYIQAYPALEIIKPGTLHLADRGLRIIALASVRAEAGNAAGREEAMKRCEAMTRNAKVCEAPEASAPAPARPGQT